MYDEKQAVAEFLAGEYRNVSQLTLGSEEVARKHEEDGHPHLAEIHRLPIDTARQMMIFLRAYDPSMYAYVKEWVLEANKGS